MAVDKEVVTKKLQELERYVRELEDLRDWTLDQLRESLHKSWSVEHGLQLAIQLVIDTGNHILAAVGENRIDEYSDIIDRLGEKGIIPPEFARTIRDMTGFRNILVHEYIEVDLETVHHVLQNRLGDFHDFGRYIRAYLKKE